MNEDAALKLCPFCGCNARIELKLKGFSYDDENELRETIRVRCLRCGSRTKNYAVESTVVENVVYDKLAPYDGVCVPDELKDSRAYQNAIRAWNIRNNGV